MPQIAYSAQNTALYHPEQGDSVLRNTHWPNEVALAGEMSRLAYWRAEVPGNQQLERLQGTLQNAGFASPALLIDKSHDAYGFGCIAQSGLCVLAFRGTQADHYEDFITNIQVISKQWPVACEHGRVHKGFRDSAIGLLAQTLGWLQSVAHQRTRLLICGHSLGGAIATLLAAPTLADALITFGCPRVGDDDFADALEARASLQIVRVVDCCDVVPTVPPSFMGYQHVGEARHIDHQGQILQSPSYAALKRDRRDARKAYAALWMEDPIRRVPIRDLADHAPINYIRAFWP